MPIDFVFRPDHNLLICRHVGTIDDEEFINSYRSVFEGGRVDPAMDLLVDLRGADSSSRSQEAIQQFAGFLKDWSRKSDNRTRVAVIAPRDVSFGLARMYEAYADSAHEEFNVFRDEEAAVEWLGISKDALQ